MDKLDVAFFELRFNPNQELISSARKLTSDFYERISPDPDAVSRLALATHEMLENAVKYASSGETHLRVEVVRNAVPAMVAVRTWNEVTVDQMQFLRDYIGELSKADPFAFYQERMRISAKRTDGSGLGLARIAFEAEMNICFEEPSGQRRACILAHTGTWKGETFQ